MPANVKYGVLRAVAILAFLALTAGLVSLNPSLEKTLATNFVWLGFMKSGNWTAMPVGWTRSPASNVEPAQLRFEQLLAQDPNNRSARRGYGLALWVNGKTAEATQYWEEHATSRDLSVVEQGLLGWGYEFLGQPQRAEMVWKRARMPIEHFLAEYSRVRVSEGNSLDALRAAQIIAALDPDNPESWMRVAQEYQNQFMQDEAIHAWETAARLSDPAQTQYWWASGRAAYARSEWEQASTAFERGLGLDPSLREMWRHFYVARFAQGDYQRAAQVASQWALQMPDDTEAYLQAGTAYLAADQMNEALSWFERAQAQNPLSAEASRWLGVVALRQGRHELARTHLNQALALNPNYAEALFDLAQLAVSEGDFAQSYALAEQAIALYPWGCPYEWLSTLGNWYQEAGQTSAAIKAFEAAIACNPEYTPARQALKVLIP